jgi:hypothetical protein
MLKALEAGITSMEQPVLVGVLPTPGIAFITKSNTQAASLYLLPTIVSG